MQTLVWMLYAAPIIFLLGCTSSPSQVSGTELPLQSETYPFTGNPLAPKRVFVFLDGTSNDAKSQTNVWRLFKAIEKAGDPQTTSIYIRGVGTANNPFPVSLSDASSDATATGHSSQKDLGLLIEMALGKEMQHRILRGYRFVAQNYRPGDQVYIFGFSRGAHQARSLAGMLAYAGVPAAVGQNGRQSEISPTLAEDILELVKKQEDDKYLSRWADWKFGMPPPLSVGLNKQLSISMVPVEIQFLGLWDTVPGSSLKEYAGCKEQVGFVKRYGGWLIPGVDKGERYKVDSYPTIRRIFHAVSADEKRSKFTQLEVCPPLPAKNPTVVKQMLFPGAHADVGGGYEDVSNHEKSYILDAKVLPGLSLNWMVTELANVYEPLLGFTKFPENALGGAHWSISEPPGNRFSICVDRTFNGIEAHWSLAKRLEAGKAPLFINGKVEADAPYPMRCPSTANNGKTKFIAAEHNFGD